MTRHYLASTLFVFALAGCVSTVETIPSDYAVTSDGDSVVFGRVVIDYGGPDPIEFFDRLTTIQLLVKNEETGDARWVQCDDGGSDSRFYVALPAGPYVVTEFEKGDLMSYVDGKFSTGQGELVYLGTVRFGAEGFASTMAASMVSGQTAIPGKWSVDDDYEATVEALRQRFSHLSGPVRKGLLTFDH